MKADKKKLQPKPSRNAGKKKLPAKANTKPPAAVPLHAPAETPAGVLDRLWSVVMTRRTADKSVSYSARLLSHGTARVAQKFGEEAVECLIEAASGNTEALIRESADVLYHMILLWVSAGIRPEQVWGELHRREGASGIAEKAARPNPSPIASGVETAKIP